LRAFENADHRTYVDLKVKIVSFLPSQAINVTWLIEHLSSLWLVLALDSTLVIILLISCFLFDSKEIFNLSLYLVPRIYDLSGPTIASVFVVMMINEIYDLFD
jgi:hypothetical protein